MLGRYDVGVVVGDKVAVGDKVVVAVSMQVHQGMVDVVVGNGFVDCENLLLLPLFRELEQLAEQKCFLKILEIN